MVVLFYLGWALLIAAFAAAASEPLVRATPGSGITLASAYDLWYTLAPGSLVVTQIRLENLAPFLWDPLVVSVLAVPAWVLLGVPGIALAWYFRPNRALTRRERDEFHKHQESLFLFDELEKAAEPRSEAGGFDDNAPDHGGHDALEEAERLPPPTDEELLEEIEAEETADQPPLRTPD